ncbi:RNA polymerase sigma-70 factor [Pedobacter sp. MC2016-14]|uniref:RNA polymerase sigma-70 factor n=1 Tax=Pedobacter sp. MC2016-14 TaxID=2897327 RepID=UPI001E4D5FFE|nr:RNA polymerase sigma-70 factor [Pedobacter sp. MC2016-14]MCD0488518.1 RNA polymerase sigma-70 factor [Pedobacter sp. MC2016-14]
MVQQDDNSYGLGDIFPLDEKSFETLYRSHWKSVFGICYHYLKDQEIAEEITQDLFTSLWERRDRLTIKTTVEKYLHRAAKLEAFEYLRTAANHQKHLDCAIKDLCTSGKCTEDSVYFNELNNNITELVEQLPCRCREVYRMSREEGLSIKHIASTLLISEKTVEYHLYKALNFLRVQLGEYQY